MASITILDTVAANIATPTTGHTSIFVDDSSGSSVLKMKDSGGNISVAGSTFTGNLLGNALSDTTSNRVEVRAAPISAVDNSSYDTLNILLNAPVYVSGVLQTPSSGGQTISGAFQSNVALQTGSGSNKTSSNLSSFAQIHATAAMNSQDRIRSGDFISEIYLNGYDWGHDNNGTRPTLVGVRNGVNVIGTGNVGCATSSFNFVSASAPGGAANNYQYLTGTQTNINSPSNTSTSTVNYARLLTGYLIDNAGTGDGFSVTNAVGLHLASGWTSQINSVTNKYAVLSQDAGTAISIQGPIITTQTLTVGNYASTALPTGSVGMVIAISNHGGRLAYWDTTNSRFSYIFDNSAV